MTVQRDRTNEHSPEVSRRLLGALQTHADGDEIEPALLAELVTEGLLTRASLAEGFQLTARGLSLISKTCAHDAGEDSARGSAA